MRRMTIMTMRISEEPKCCLYCPCLTYYEGKRHCGACGRELDDAAAYQRRPDVCPAKFTTFEEGEPMKTLVIESERGGQIIRLSCVPLRMARAGRRRTLIRRCAPPSLRGRLGKRLRRSGR